MKYQNFLYKFSWTKNERWMLPEDEVLFQNQFGIVDNIVERTLSFIPEDNKEVCIQAGACIGLWPIRYAQEFNTVITFEPLPETYECLIENVRRCGITNIETYNMALGPKDTKVEMKYSKPSNLSQSYGAYHVVETSDGNPTMRLDDIPLNGKRVGHIQLDVEGYEVKCLQSGENVIEEFRPVVVIEQRPLKQMQEFNVNVDDAKKWLEQRGYHVAEKMGNDLIMIPKERGN